MSNHHLRNRIYNCKNFAQGEHRKVLCVCSAGLLRSPTAAVVLSQPPFNFNTRAAGLTDEFALIPVDDVLLAWADEIVCMEEKQVKILTSRLEEASVKPIPIKCLKISDTYEYRSPKLMEMIAENYVEASRENDRDATYID